MCCISVRGILMCAVVLLGPNSPSAGVLSAIQDLESQIEEQKHKIQTTSNHLLRVWKKV